MGLGYGFLIDFASYSQNDASKQQFPDLESDAGLRDFRLMFKGKFKTKRPFSWTMGRPSDRPPDCFQASGAANQVGSAALGSIIGFQLESGL